CLALAVPILSAEWKVPAGAFGAAIGAVTIGVTLGATILAPLGDKIGRRPLLIAGTMWFGFCALGSATAASLAQLFAWRLGIGLGIGFCIPSAFALVADFTPSRYKSSCLTVLMSGVSLGAFGSGIVAPWIVDAYGWQGLFALGGAVPVLLGLL